MPTLRAAWRVGVVHAIIDLLLSVLPLMTVVNSDSTELAEVLHFFIRQRPDEEMELWSQNDPTRSDHSAAVIVDHFPYVGSALVLPSNRLLPRYKSTFSLVT